jgi:hypothetical protein
VELCVLLFGKLGGQMESVLAGFGAVHGGQNTFEHGLVLGAAAFIGVAGGLLLVTFNKAILKLRGRTYSILVLKKMCI